MRKPVWQGTKFDMHEIVMDPFGKTIKLFLGTYTKRDLKTAVKFRKEKKLKIKRSRFQDKHFFQ
jgi:hypothetical protein